MSADQPLLPTEMCPQPSAENLTRGKNLSCDTAANAVLKLSGLCVGYSGTLLLRGVEEALAPGELVAVMGPSGAGKTSLLRCVAGMMEPVEGSVRFAFGPGQDGLTPRQCRRCLGMVFQHLRLVPNATVLTNVLCGALGHLPSWRTLFGFPREEKQRALSLLEAMEIGHLAHCLVSKTSGGERQRTAIARALMGRPRVLLADEPVSHLDRRLAAKVLDFLRAYALREDMAILCVLHDRELARRFAHRVWEVRGEALMPAC